MKFQPQRLRADEENLEGSMQFSLTELYFVVISGVLKFFSSQCFISLMPCFVYVCDLLGDAELKSKSLKIQSKRFYVDLKQNRRGKFIKIAEVSPLSNNEDVKPASVGFDINRILYHRKPL